MFCCDLLCFVLFLLCFAMLLCFLVETEGPDLSRKVTEAVILALFRSRSDSRKPKSEQENALDKLNNLFWVVYIKHIEILIQIIKT